MTLSARTRLRFGAGVVAVAAAVASHVAPGMGLADGVAAGLAGLQAVATGAILWASLPRRPWVGVLVAAMLLGGLVAGGQAAASGVAHTMLYGALLVSFGATLRPGRVAVATRLARRLNPQFREHQVPYTRAVTWAWVGLFAGQLLVSGLLLVVRPRWWQGFVTIGHAVPCVLLFVAEAGVRRWRWRGQATGLRDMIRGVRAGMVREDGR